MSESRRVLDAKHANVTYKHFEVPFVLIEVILILSGYFKTVIQ